MAALGMRFGSFLSHLRQNRMKKEFITVASRIWVEVGGASSLHTCAGLSAGQGYRIRTGQSRSGTEYGPLTDLPDWSFVDGRPAPISKRAAKRDKWSEHISSRIQRLMAEVDKAEQHQKQLQEGKADKTEDTEIDTHYQKNK